MNRKRKKYDQGKEIEPGKILMKHEIKLLEDTDKEVVQTSGGA